MAPVATAAAAVTAAGIATAIADGCTRIRFFRAQPVDLRQLEDKEDEKEPIVEKSCTTTTTTPRIPAAAATPAAAAPAPPATTVIATAAAADDARVTAAGAAAADDRGRNGHRALLGKTRQSSSSRNRDGGVFR